MVLASYKEEGIELSCIEDLTKKQNHLYYGFGDSPMDAFLAIDVRFKMSRNVRTTSAWTSVKTAVACNEIFRGVPLSLITRINGINRRI